MNFRRESPNEHYRDLRLVSLECQWELGLSLYASGMRLRMGRCGRPPQALDFCLGQDGEIFLPVLGAVIRELESLAEECTEIEINALFPWGQGRPDLAVHLDALLSGARAENPR